MRQQPVALGALHGALLADLLELELDRADLIPEGSRELLTVLVLIAVAALTYDVTCFKRSGGKDACHPNDIGYGQLAAAVRRAIAESY